MELRARVEGLQTVEQLKEARRQITTKTREGLREAGQRAILPPVRRRAPAVISPNMRTGATSRAGYVTTLGSRTQDRIAGLLNFGGLVTTQIFPKRKQALTVGRTGIIRASVTRPRHYIGKRFIERGMEEGLPELERITLQKLMESYEGLSHTP